MRRVVLLLSITLLATATFATAVRADAGVECRALRETLDLRLRNAGALPDKIKNTETELASVKKQRDAAYIVARRTQSAGDWATHDSLSDRYGILNELLKGLRKNFDENERGIAALRVRIEMHCETASAAGATNGVVVTLRGKIATQCKGKRGEAVNLEIKLDKGKASGSYWGLPMHGSVDAAGNLAMTLDANPREIDMHGTVRWDGARWTGAGVFLNHSPTGTACGGNPWTATQ